MKKLFLKLLLWLNQYQRKQAFLLLVQTAALHYDLRYSLHNPQLEFNPLWLLDDAARVDPVCIPDNLEEAAWAFVDTLLKKEARPKWVRYLPEGLF